jgi:hypothetical protein
MDSLLQPGTHSGFLMSPSPWVATQKAAQTREAPLEVSLRPTSLHLLPQRVQHQPAQQPTAHHGHRGQGDGP